MPDADIASPDILIHAPTRGATKVQSFVFGQMEYFNPRSHKGSDIAEWEQSPARGLFQSTLPQGERLNSLQISLITRSISIHAPTRGATWSDSAITQIEYISIHAPTRGATL